MKDWVLKILSSKWSVKFFTILGTVLIMLGAIILCVLGPLLVLWWGVMLLVHKGEFWVSSGFSLLPTITEDKQIKIFIWEVDYRFKNKKS